MFMHLAVPWGGGECLAFVVSCVFLVCSGGIDLWLLWIGGVIIIISKDTLNHVLPHPPWQYIGNVCDEESFATGTETAGCVPTP